MKLNELKDIIRTVVKEEIAQSIPIILSEMANALGGNTPPTNTPASMLNETVHHYTATQPVRRAQPAPVPPHGKKIYTHNTALNDVLNATRGGIPQTEMGGMVMQEESMEVAEPMPGEVDIMGMDFRERLAKANAIANQRRG